MNNDYSIGSVVGVENGNHEIKSDNGDTIENVAIESDTWNDSGDSNDDTVSKNSGSLSAVKIKNKVGEVNTSDNQKEVSLSANKVLIDKVSRNNSDNYNYKGEIITNHNGVSLNVKQVAVNKVSNNVSYDDVNKSGILLNKNCLLYTSRCV